MVVLLSSCGRPPVHTSPTWLIRAKQEQIASGVCVLPGGGLWSDVCCSTVGSWFRACRVDLSAMSC